MNLRPCSTPCPRHCTGPSSPWPALGTGTSLPPLLRVNWWPPSVVSVALSASLCLYQSLLLTSTGNYVTMNLNIPKYFSYPEVIRSQSLRWSWRSRGGTRACCGSRPRRASWRRGASSAAPTPLHVMVWETGGNREANITVECWWCSVFRLKCQTGNCGPGDRGKLINGDYQRVPLLAETSVDITKNVNWRII